MSKKVTIITHSGSFHPDDVFAVAVLSLLEKRPTVIRTRDEKIIAAGDYIVDVGGVYNEKKNLFDHHMTAGAGMRQNGIPYASFGLVWKKFGGWLCENAKCARVLDEQLVQYIDAMDGGIDIIRPLRKGVYPYTLSDVVFSYLPTWREKEYDESIIDRRFLEAVQFAKALLEREISSTKDFEEGKCSVEKAYRAHKDKRVIVLEHDYPRMEELSWHPETLFCIYPQEHNWHVKAVRDDARSFRVRLEFPRTWAGKRNDELAAVSGVPDAVFCHSNRFMAVAKSKEGALALAEKALSF